MKADTVLKFTDDWRSFRMVLPEDQAHILDTCILDYINGKDFDDTEANAVTKASILFLKGKIDKIINAEKQTGRARSLAGKASAKNRTANSC